MVAPVSRIDPSSDDSSRSSGIRRIGMLFVFSVDTLVVLLSSISL